MAASSEFIALCRAQLTLLTQTLGASVSAVYLTEQWIEGAETKLIPIVTYPETGVGQQLEHGPLLLPADRATVEVSLPGQQLVSSSTSTQPSEQEPIVIPLIHAEVVMGLLVTGRKDRPWNDREQTQLDKVADTLALACVLDQRSQWLAQNHQQQRLIYNQQHDLLHNLLHQFRNPLTALRTFGKLLLKRLLLEDPNRDVAAGIIRESDRLQELLKQFEQAVDVDQCNDHPLTLPQAELEANQRLLLPAATVLGEKPIPKPCLLVDILQPLFTSLTAIAQERDLSLDLPNLNSLPPVQVDANALQEVLSNLVDNALKYTPSGGQVFIQVLPQYQPDLEALPTFQHPPTWLGIAISDTGPGIPPADQARLFERHFRGIQADGNIPGTGLGLAIAHELIQQMGGRIQVFSPARILPGPNLSPSGPGSTFIVWVPVAQPDWRHL